MSGFDFTVVQCALQWDPGYEVEGPFHRMPGWRFYCTEEWKRDMLCKQLVYSKCAGVGFGDASKSLERAICWLSRSQGWRLDGSGLRTIIEARFTEMDFPDSEDIAQAFIGEDAGS